MRVRSDRRFTFDVGRDAVWSAIADVDRYRHWWPWLASFEAEGLVAGDEWRCVVQPPLPYRLRFRIRLDDVVAGRRATATVTGQIEGTAALTLADGDGVGCEARLVSDLAPSDPLMRAVATVAWPVVRRGHDWVIDTGARQFRGRAL